MSLYEDYEQFDERDFSVFCNRCGEEDLHWEMTDEGWRLFDENGDQHVCYPPSADDFEVLDA